MIRLLVLMTLIVALFPGVAHAQAAEPIRSAALPGLTNTQVAVYGSGSDILVVRRGGREIWRQRIVGQLRALLVPGPAGLFAAVTTRPHGGSVYAFDASATGIASALSGRPSGRVYGDEGIVLLRTGFRVREKDWTHQGSVPYRTITQYVLRGHGYTLDRTWIAPDLVSQSYPVPNAVFHPKDGSRILLRLEVAATEAAREQGLMYRQTLDPDSGMIFVWPTPVLASFWMENTYIPLSVAFITPDGRVEDIQDMAPLTTSLHTPPKPYLYAIEVNQGYFARASIAVGDAVTLNLGAGTLVKTRSKAI